MTPIVAILTLLAATSGATPRDPVSGFELLPLPAGRGLTVEVDPLGRSVVLDAPSSAPAVAEALRATSRLICPDVVEGAGRVLLRCRSTRVTARVVGRGAALALELVELPGLPGQGPLAVPIVFHDPLALGLGSCPGDNHAARGECRLRDGRRDLARGSFLTATRSSSAAERSHARLRLGDLALASGDAAAALRQWAAVETAPWTRMAEARRCELSVHCLVAAGDAPFARDSLPLSLAREMTLRSARVRAFRGDPLSAAWQLASEFSAAGACAGEGALCRRIVLAALRDGDGAHAAEALAIYAAAVKPGPGPWSSALAEAAAEAASRVDAPSYGAALLASTAALEGPRLEGRLLRAAGLYVAAEDPVRARVIVDFVRGRARPGALLDPRWAAVEREIAALRLRPPAAHRAARGGTPELVAAARALAAARAVPLPPGDPP